MKNDTLCEIYSRHGLGNFSKSVDILNSVGTTLLDVFNEDKTTQDQFMFSINEVIRKYKPRGNT